MQHHHIETVLELAAADERILGSGRRKPEAAAALVVPERVGGRPRAVVAHVDAVDPATEADRLAGGERHGHRLAAVKGSAVVARLDTDRRLQSQRTQARFAA